MIKGNCFTYIDEYKMAAWPTVFAAVPRIGERVAARNGASLRVVQVTHYEHESEAGTHEPRIRVELHRGVGP